MLAHIQLSVTDLFQQLVLALGCRERKKSERERNEK